MSKSIILKVTLLFIFSSISFIFFSFYFINEEKLKNNKLIEQKYEDIIIKVHNLFNDKKHAMFLIQQYLLDMGLVEVKDPKIIQAIAQRYTYSIGIYPIITDVKKVEGDYYIIILDTKNANINLYTNDDDNNVDYNNHYVFSSLVFITLVFFYILVLQSLLPLRDLRREVKKFASGNMNIKTISNNKDEIGELSGEFTKAAYTINKINKSRILFLRSIMHELKTPITKGLVISEMLKEEKAKSRLKLIFRRLNNIIDEFAKLEEITSRNYKLEKTRFKLVDLMENINKMLFMDYERPRNVLLEDRNADIFADFNALSLSVKNLIDNAIKYSPDSKAIIFVKDSSLVIKNSGSPFKNEITHYFKPFYNDGSTNPKKGLGLGMYIVKNTIELQNFQLEYEYKNNYHYFYIKGCILQDKDEND